MESLNVFIYCRISENSKRDLLDCQEKELQRLANLVNLNVVAVVKEVSTGKNFSSRGIQSLKHYVQAKKIDIVLVYDNTRLVIFDDLYDELKLFCNKYGVAIMVLEEIKSFISISK